MEHELIPDTLEEFERQFGREHVAACAARCHVFLGLPKDRLSDADRRELFKTLLEHEPQPSDQQTAPYSAPADSTEETAPHIEAEVASEPQKVPQPSAREGNDRVEWLERELYRLQQLIQLTELRAQQAEAARDRTQPELQPTSDQFEVEQRLRQQAEQALEKARARLASAAAKSTTEEQARAASRKRCAHLEQQLLEKQSRVTELERDIRQLAPEQLERLKRRLDRLETERRDASAEAEVAKGKLIELRRQRRDLDSKLATAERARALSGRKLTKALIRVEEMAAEIAIVKDVGLKLFNNARVRTWAEKQSRTRACWTPPGSVVVVGHDPLPVEAFAALLVSRGIRAAEIGDSDVAVMIVGREGWLVDDIEDQITVRAGHDLFIYSQEMFLTALLVGKDLFRTAENKTLLEFAVDHEALRCCIDEGFMWPAIPTATIARILDPQIEAVEESPLHEMGYRVGKTNGVPKSRRREILEVAFRGALPTVKSSAYMKRWGTPNSRRRLRRMATAIDWYIVQAMGRQKKRKHDMSVAIDEWSGDLAWMNDELYEPWMRFHWPNTHVDGPSIGRRRRVRA